MLHQNASFRVSPLGSKGITYDILYITLTQDGGSAVYSKSGQSPSLTYDGDVGTGAEVRFESDSSNNMDGFEFTYRYIAVEGSSSSSSTPSGPGSSSSSSSSSSKSGAVPNDSNNNGIVIAALVGGVLVVGAVGSFVVVRRHRASSDGKPKVRVSFVHACVHDTDTLMGGRYTPLTVMRSVLGSLSCPT